MEKLRAIASECAALLGDNLMCFGYDGLAQVVADQLRAQGRTLAVAEAATGGLLANSFADLCGACKFFQGGFVSYSNDSKMLMLECPECLLKQHGAVSPECAVRDGQRRRRENLARITGSRSRVSPALRRREGESRRHDLHCRAHAVRRLGAQALHPRPAFRGEAARRERRDRLAAPRGAEGSPTVLATPQVN
ncbi:MAG: nicotinamide-nucleotide amidohydrolase family protein [Lacunisphaera sp.]